LIKRTIQIFALISGISIIVVMAAVSYSKWFNNVIAIVPSPYRYGDLYFFSNHPKFRINTSNQAKINKVKSQSNIRLTIIGDSYLNGISKENLIAKNFDHIDWDYVPDTIPSFQSGKKNILVIETTERYARWRLKIRNLVGIGEKYIPPINHEIKLNAEDNIQFLLTNFDFLLNLKEIKSLIYLKLFNRYDSRIAKPNGAERLYLNETIEESLTSSSYSSISEEEISEIVNNLNMVQQDVLKLGFEEVYLSIIPNAASIYNYNGKKYNHLIERIQQHPNLKMTCINAYQLLSAPKDNVFHYSDSHWNSFGQQLWIDEINKTISTPKN